jgi:hypothetical protein
MNRPDETAFADRQPLYIEEFELALPDEEEIDEANGRMPWVTPLLYFGSGLIAGLLIAALYVLRRFLH